MGQCIPPHPCNLSSPVKTPPMSLYVISSMPPRQRNPTTTRNGRWPQISSAGSIISTICTPRNSKSKASPLKSLRVDSKNHRICGKSWLQFCMTRLVQGKYGTHS
eukprot:PhF_6_TR4872/c0_g1_i1/m.6846